MISAHGKTVEMIRTIVICLFCCVCPSCSNAAARVAPKRFVLVIDPGHGGKDHGATGKLTREKDINLNVALAFGKLVEANCPEVKVIYTRTTDKFVTLQGRADIANSNKADLFISIHTNSMPSNKNHVYGAETYSLGMHRSVDNLEVAKRENSVITLESNYKQTYQNFDPRKAESYIIFELLQDRNMKQSVEMASCLQREYVRQGRKNKGVKQSGFLVLRATSMPSILTELGFISHAEEERFMHSPEGVRKLSRALFDGFQAYRGSSPVSSGAEQALTPQTLPTEESTVELAIETREALSAKDKPLKAEVVPVPTRSVHDCSECMEESVKAAPQKTTKTEDLSLDAHRLSDSEAIPTPSVQIVSTQEVPPPTEPFRPAPRTTTREHPSTPTPPAQTHASAGPVFKVQLLTSDRMLGSGSRHFKGVSPIEHYGEKGNYKYTHGVTTDYNEARQIKKKLSEAFPEAFIVAFLDGKRIDLHKAIQLSRASSHSKKK